MIEKKLDADIFKHGGFNSFIKKAQEIGVGVSFLKGTEKILKLEFKGKVVYVKKSVIPVVRFQGQLTKDKDITKYILEDAGVNVPKGIMTASCEQALELIENHKMNFPLIAKPSDGSRAVGVTWDIKNKEELEKAVNLIKEKQDEGKSFLNSKEFIVEEMFRGNEYRVLVLNGKVVSCVHKIPATVIGDGKSSIRSLIDEFNKTRNEGFEIKVDDIVMDTLAQNNLEMESVLPENFNLRLRWNMNMSDGGRSVECTDIMNEYFKDVCEKSIKVLGLNYGGVDLMVEDITSAKSPYVILEINPNPFYNMHEKPLVEGKGIDVSSMLLRDLFPGI